MFQILGVGSGTFSGSNGRTFKKWELNSEYLLIRNKSFRIHNTVFLREIRKNIFWWINFLYQFFTTLGLQGGPAMAPSCLARPLCCSKRAQRKECIISLLKSLQEHSPAVLNKRILYKLNISAPPHVVTRFIPPRVQRPSKRFCSSPDK